MKLYVNFPQIGMRIFAETQNRTAGKARKSKGVNVECNYAA
jgi:hypothetical protein